MILLILDCKYGQLMAEGQYGCLEAEGPAAKRAKTYVLSIPSLPEGCCPYAPVIMVAGGMFVVVSICVFV